MVFSLSFYLCRGVSVLPSLDVWSWHSSVVECSSTTFQIERIDVATCLMLACFKYPNVHHGIPCAHPYCHFSPPNECLDGQLHDARCVGTKLQIRRLTGQQNVLICFLLLSFVTSSQMPGRGGNMARAAGTSAIIQFKEKDAAILCLPSGEFRRSNLVSCLLHGLCDVLPFPPML